MENASKALIMAASVLIGVLILSLAVFLFSEFSATSARIHGEVEKTQKDQFKLRPVYLFPGKKQLDSGYRQIFPGVRPVVFLPYGKYQYQWPGGHGQRFLLISGRS